MVLLSENLENHSLIGSNKTCCSLFASPKRDDVAETNCVENSFNLSLRDASASGQWKSHQL